MTPAQIRQHVRVDQALERMRGIFLTYEHLHSMLSVVEDLGLPRARLHSQVEKLHAEFNGLLDEYLSLAHGF